MEEFEEISDGSNGWEKIQSPTNPTPQQTVVTIHRHNDDCSVFPPSEHEGLNISTEPTHDEQNTSSSSSFSSDVDQVGSQPLPTDSRLRVLANDMTRRLRLGFEVLHSKILRLACWVRCYGSNQWKVWSISSAAGVVAVLLFSILFLGAQRWRRRYKQESNKDRLMLLIKEKDEKIHQLLHQIAQMNELLFGRRRVLVLRSN